MALLKFEDFYPDHQSASSAGFNIDDLKHYDVYANNDKVGSISDILVDETDGRIRYLVVDTGFWVFGKKVLLPVGRADISYSDRCIYVNSMTKEQVERLPNYDNLEKVDYDYEEQVRNVYRPASTATAAAAPKYNRDSYQYDYDRDLYDRSNNDSLKLYEERLVANKKRQKAGEVSVGKHVETETARASIPVEKERVVIDRITPKSGAVNPREATFQSGEVAHVDVYEETADVRKEAFVREEVRVRKEVEQDTVTAEEQLRREELDIDAQGNPTIDRKR